MGLLMGGRGGLLPMFGASGVTYLLRDEFTTDRAPGAVNGTAAEPGAGTRTLVDTQSKIFINNGKLYVGKKTSTSWGDPAMSLDAIGRAAGVALHAQITASNTAVAGCCVGLGITQNALPAQHGIYHYPGGLYYIYEGGNSAILAVRPADGCGTRFAILMRASGAHYFIKGSGIFPTWTLLWSTVGKNAATVTPVLVNNGIEFTSDYFKGVDHKWLPNPLISDGFGGTFGESDGLGHAESSGLGSGGGGKTISATVGTWQNSGGMCNATSLSGGIAVATTVTSTPNVMLSAKLTRSGGHAGYVVRWTDASNYIRVIYSGTQWIVTTVIAGAETTVKTDTIAYSAGATAIVWLYGRWLNLFYNGQRTGAIYVALPASLSSTTHGLWTTDVTNLFDDLVASDVAATTPFDLIGTGSDKMLLSVGDSKSYLASWISGLIALLEPDLAPAVIAESSIQFAVSGASTAYMAGYIAEHINNALLVGQPDFVTYSLGANDVVAMPSESTWKANTTGSINALLAKWPNAQIYISRPWRRSYLTECNTLATWIADVVALYPNNCHLGPDERIYLEGGDDGLTMTSDGIHPKTDATTQGIVASAWKAAMGY